MFDAFMKKETCLLVNLNIDVNDDVKAEHIIYGNLKLYFLFLFIPVFWSFIFS